jgi:tRNA pseudouridine38-40 synthase
MRIALGIEYDGTAFSGWQIQKNDPSVQACLEKALSSVADHPVQLVCAGRTDAGVHALGQVAHFDTDSSRPGRAWTLGVNSELPPGISVCWAKTVADDFHARYGAKARSYSYLVFNNPIRSALLSDRAWWVRRALDVESMQRAGARLVGTHDFSSFRAAGCQAGTPVRNVTRLDVRRLDDSMIRLDITANAFLHHMVRNIAGTLAMVGRGEKPESWLSEVLEARNRGASGVTAPPGGLYLLHVAYGSQLDQPRPPALTRRALGLSVQGVRPVCPTNLD